jgi:ATP-dependent helicase HrpA
VMVAELVETSRLWGRTAAKVDPRWVEPLAAHLVKRSYAEPHWERKRASVVATERVTLYGLPVVAGRKVAYGSIDPELSRSLFIRRALVEGDWDTRHAFFAANAALREEVEALEERARRRDILVDDQALYDFYDARIPQDVVSGAHFDRWWRDARRDDPDRLTFTRADLVSEGADALDRRALPEAWKQGDLTMRLSYVFDPGSARDGVTVHVPLKWLPRLEPVGFDWLVPALRPELVTALIRSLPKELRRPLVPVPEVAAAVLERVKPRSEPLLDALARELEALRGVRIPREAWDLDRLPTHLKMTFRVEDERGAVVAEGDDLDALREQVRPRLREALSSAAAPLEHHGLTDWTIGTLPNTVALPGTGQAVRGYPSLVDEGATVGVRVLETPEAQRVAMQAGTRKLLALNVPSPIRHVAGKLDNAAQLTLAAAPHASLRAVLEDATIAALEDLMAEAGGPAWDEAGFRRLRAHVAGHLADRTAQAVRDAVRILDAARDVERRLEPLARSVALAPARDDVRTQLRRLVHPGFITAAGVKRLPDVDRYLRAAERRLERLPDAPAPDLDKLRGVHDLEREYEARVASWPDGRALPATLREVPWLLEELRVSHFAQALGTRGQVSAKRIRKQIRDAAP